MKIREKMVICLTLASLLVVLFLTGCQPTETDTGQQAIIEERGILVGLVDNQSVEIEIDGIERVFALGENVSVSHITDGSEVLFSYVEEENRPVILTIEVIESTSEVITANGIYNGQIDSHSVEIELNGEPVAFSISENLSFDDLAEGAKIEFTYIEEENRLLLLSVDHIEMPGEIGQDLLIGEGIYIGQIDAQSVEIKLNRAFTLADDIEIDTIEDGALVAFTFSESGQRAVIESIKAVDQPVEGDVAHGMLIGQIDSQSVEIEYFQVYAIGSASLAGISEDDYIIFTYQLGEHRPILISVEEQ